MPTYAERKAQQKKADRYRRQAKSMRKWHRARPEPVQAPPLDAGIQRLKCTDCAKMFDGYVAMKYCPQCRKRRALWCPQGDLLPSPPLTPLERAWLEAEPKLLWDYRILDENHREVWASELQKRYIRETRPRGLHRRGRL